MKETTLERFVQEPDALMEAAQNERILVTRNGRPFAIVVGIANKDAEDLRIEESEEFWQMIEDRRQRPTVPVADAEAELFAGDQ